MNEATCMFVICIVQQVKWNTAVKRVSITI